MWEDVNDHLAGLDNVYFDTSMSSTMGLSRKLALKIISRHPADNILLGSDCPWEDPAVSVRWVEALGLGSDRTEAVLGGNAQRILGLGEIAVNTGGL